MMFDFIKIKYILIITKKHIEFFMTIRKKNAQKH